MICSNHAGITGSERQERVDPKKKVKTEILCNDIIKQYNASMVEINLSDMLIELYQTRITTKKYWCVTAILQCMDIDKTNAWFSYRWNCKLIEKQKKHIISLYKFIPQIAMALWLKNKNPKKPLGWPSKKKSLLPTLNFGRKPFQPTPMDEIRLDGYVHWSDIYDTCSRCKRRSMTCSS